eukprot:scaffold15472_cov117-Cylindrotheca_fusiformis.AAC.12
MEGKALLLRDETSATKSSMARKVEDVTADGYSIMPLKERWVISRLDIGPFLAAYAILVFLDLYNGIEDHDTAMIAALSRLLFPLVLLAHLALFLLQQWDVFWLATVGYKRLSLSSPKAEWTHCLIEAPHVDKHHAAHDAEIVPIQEEGNAVFCSFQDIIFRYAAEETDGDIAIWSTKGQSDLSKKSGTQSFHRLQYPIHFPLSFYKNWSGHITISSFVQAQRLYGSNTTPIRLPPFLEMLQEQLVAPFFLFQVLCVLLWCLDEYWYYAVFTFFALLMFESTVAYNRLKSLERLRSHTLNGYDKHVWAHRPAYPPGENGWVRVSASELLPGDIVSCKEAEPRNGTKSTPQQKQQLNRVPADILILSGDVVVDESLLTGESVPQLKTALDDNSDRALDLQEHKQSICFGGTTLLVSHPGDAKGGPRGIPTAPDDGVVGLVLRTGFETAQGSLLRTMAHTQKSVDGIHTKDTYVFILLLLLCAIASAYMVWKEGWADESRNKFRLVLHVIMIVTSVVPPELPMELSLAVTNSVADLMKRCQVYCTEIFRIPIAGQIDVCCFDKTAQRSPTSKRRCFQQCRGAGQINAVGTYARYQLVHNHALQKEEPHPKHPDTIAILHRFGFSSRLKRMTVLAREDTSETVWALTKGAPEVIKTLLKPESCPKDYDQVSMQHMTMGQRVLAMAYRKLSKKESGASLKDAKRETLENDLIFAGFLLLDCPVKGDSKELQQSGHQVVMITGDSVWTAVEVARQVGIVSTRKAAFPPSYHLQQVSSGTETENTIDDFKFVPIGMRALPGNGGGELSASPSYLGKLKRMVDEQEATLCISGDILQKLVMSIVDREEVVPMLKKEEKHALFHPSAQAILKDIVPLVSVFARHAPRQKEAIIAAFNLGGYKTLMCGDGTNDMASLRRAHVGISIISAPEVEAKQRTAAAKLSAAKTQHKKEKKKKGKSNRATSNSSLQESLRQLQEAQDDLDQVELGDASIASPFTSRTVSIKCCKDVLQQGRCTLVTMLQIYKILGINCLVNAMVLSNLFLHGVKQGDRQLTVTGLAIAMLFLFVTRGKPLKTISPVRPPASVLCLSALSSIALQFGIHFWGIRLTSQVALSFVDPYDPSMIPDGPFNPNTLNTCTFLMNVLATVNTFAVNYRGEPFVEPLKKNKMLLRSLQICYAILACCALELFPPLSDLLQLSEYPETQGEALKWDGKYSEADIFLPIAKGIVASYGFPTFMFGLMVLDTSMTFALEKLVLLIFEPTPNSQIP